MMADREFSPDAIDDRLAEEHLQNLASGKEPTTEELAQWRMRLRELALAGECDGLLLRFWCATHTDRRELWWRTRHGDGRVVKETAGMTRP